MYAANGDCRFSQGTLGTDRLFTGQRLDGTGLYYYGARYYDSSMGRFVSADTVVPSASNPQTLNRYSYCLNNPLKYIDPSGNKVSLSVELIWSLYSLYTVLCKMKRFFIFINKHVVYKGILTINVVR